MPDITISATIRSYLCIIDVYIFFLFFSSKIDYSVIRLKVNIVLYNMYLQWKIYSSGIVYDIYRRRLNCV